MLSTPVTEEENRRINRMSLTLPIRVESQVNGRIVSKVVSVFGDPTDYSPMK